MDTENIDRLFLELSQFTQAATGKELLLKKQMTTQQSTITALVEALTEAIELIEREICSTASSVRFPPRDHTKLDGTILLSFPAKEYDIAAMRAALSKAQREGN